MTVRLTWGLVSLALGAMACSSGTESEPIKRMEPVETETATCGNRVVEEGEVCDGDPYCSRDCDEVIGECGDGIVLANVEECDPGAVDEPGCVGCQQMYTYSCSGEPSVCGRSGLPDEAYVTRLTEEELVPYCEWYLDLFGGAGRGLYCSHGDFWIVSVEECQDTVPRLWGACTVADVVEFASAYAGPCEFSRAKDPPCVDAEIPEPTADCEELESVRSRTLDEARSCDATSVHACSGEAELLDECGCPVASNGLLVEEIDAARSARESWLNASCEPPDYCDLLDCAPAALEASCSDVGLACVF